jgi:hypothetical protein
MTHDQIINEVRQARADILAQYGGDVHKMLRAMQEKQKSSGHPVVTCPAGAYQTGIKMPAKAAEARTVYKTGERG